MPESAAQTAAPEEKRDAPADEKHAKKGRRRWGKGLLIAGGVLIVLLIAARIALPRFLLWYVNRTINQSELYEGNIGDIDVSLWRGAYAIKQIRLNKVTGNVPVPLYSAERVDLALQWSALREGKLVGQIVMQRPELNFVDGESDSEDQTGAGGPWLQIIQDLFPFKINSCLIHDGSVRFRAFSTKPPVDVYLSELEGSIENLTNIRDEVTPLVSTVHVDGLAMDQAKFEYEMKLDPFSYRPTFQLALRLIGLDVTKTNDLARAYGNFDFEGGWFDLVIELNAREGGLEGYVKPLFRDLKVLSLKKDIPEDNVIEFFWEALVGITTGILRNPPRDQFGTNIPLSGSLNNPQTDLLATIGNVLRNAFIRAYLPRLEAGATDIDDLHFAPGSVSDPVTDLNP
jgi:hypothetical protein